MILQPSLGDRYTKKKEEKMEKRRRRRGRRRRSRRRRRRRRRWRNNAMRAHEGKWLKSGTGKLVLEKI